MNTTEFAKTLQEGIKEITGVRPNANEARQLVDLVFDSIKERIKQGEVTDIIGFGKFETVQRAERNGRNPSNGKPLIIEAKVSPKFTFKPKFKEEVKENFKK